MYWRRKRGRVERLRSFNTRVSWQRSLAIAGGDREWSTRCGVGRAGTHLTPTGFAKQYAQTSRGLSNNWSLVVRLYAWILTLFDLLTRPSTWATQSRLSPM